MRSLTVQDFSCIENASLELGRLTVLIGPQGSGKSVLSKLTYFFYNLLQEQFTAIEENQDIDQFKEKIKELFKEWFPISAWGTKKFLIQFEAGAFQVRLTRVERKGALHENLLVWLSPFFEEQYEESLKFVRAGIEKSKGSGSPAEFEAIWRVREITEKNWANRLGKDHISSQLFIPAGRAFFTSVGKAVAAFEQARILDPVTVRFGRLFASLRDEGLLRWERPAPGLSGDLMQQLFGGKIVIKRGEEYVDTTDGRRVPFTSLSSGQQELLPLWLALDFWVRRPSRSQFSQLTYIEEPEAHLFPTAQSALVQLLASIVASSKNSLSIVVTTHSPYVLSKINNLVKAGIMAEKLPSKHDSIAKVIPRTAWLGLGSVKAYGIMNNNLHSILDDDGLINGDYLDDISGDIAKEFSTLLSIEAANAAP